MKIFNLFKSKPKPSKEEINPNSFLLKNDEIFIYNSTITLSNVLDIIKDKSRTLGIYLNNGATDLEINDFERNKTILPDDFKLLYKFSNGFETEHDLFRLIPLDEILNNNDDSYLISSNSFHFTEYMIYIDMWSVDVDIKDKNQYKIYNKADDVVVLTNSIAEFLSIFINKGIYNGLYEWRENIKAKTI